MDDFDPDEYLANRQSDEPAPDDEATLPANAEPTQGTAPFDPDKYIADFNPDKYLASKQAPAQPQAEGHLAADTREFAHGILPAAGMGVVGGAIAGAANAYYGAPLGVPGMLAAGVAGALVGGYLGGKADDAVSHVLGVDDTEQRQANAAARPIETNLAGLAPMAGNPLMAGKTLAQQAAARGTAGGVMGAFDVGQQAYMNDGDIDLKHALTGAAFGAAFPNGNAATRYMHGVGEAAGGKLIPQSQPVAANTAQPSQPSQTPPQARILPEQNTPGRPGASNPAVVDPATVAARDTATQSPPQTTARGTAMEQPAPTEPADAIGYNNTEAGGPENHLKDQPALTGQRQGDSVGDQPTSDPTVQAWANSELAKNQSAQKAAQKQGGVPASPAILPANNEAPANFKPAPGREAAGGDQYGGMSRPAPTAAVIPPRELPKPAPEAPKVSDIEEISPQEAAQMRARREARAGILPEKAPIAAVEPKPDTFEPTNPVTTNEKGGRILRRTNDTNEVAKVPGVEEEGAFRDWQEANEQRAAQREVAEGKAGKIDTWGVEHKRKPDRDQANQSIKAMEEAYLKFAPPEGGETREQSLARAQEALAAVKEANGGKLPKAGEHKDKPIRRWFNAVKSYAAVPEVSRNEAAHAKFTSNELLVRNPDNTETVAKNDMLNRPAELKENTPAPETEIKHEPEEDTTASILPHPNDVPEDTPVVQPENFAKFMSEKAGAPKEEVAPKKTNRRLKSPVKHLGPGDIGGNERIMAELAKSQHRQEMLAAGRTGKENLLTREEDRAKPDLFDHMSALWRDGVSLTKSIGESESGKLDVKKVISDVKALKDKLMSSTGLDKLTDPYALDVKSHYAKTPKTDAEDAARGPDQLLHSLSSRISNRQAALLDAAEKATGRFMWGKDGVLDRVIRRKPGEPVLDKAASQAIYEMTERAQFSEGGQRIYRQGISERDQNIPYAVHPDTDIRTGSDLAKAYGKYVLPLQRRSALAFYDIQKHFLDRIDHANTVGFQDADAEQALAKLPSDVNNHVRRELLNGDEVLAKQAARVDADPMTGTRRLHTEITGPLAERDYQTLTAPDGTRAVISLGSKDGEFTVWRGGNPTQIKDPGFTFKNGGKYQGYTMGDALTNEIEANVKNKKGEFLQYRKDALSSEIATVSYLENYLDTLKTIEAVKKTEAFQKYTTQNGNDPRVKDGTYQAVQLENFKDYFADPQVKYALDDFAQRGINNDELNRARQFAHAITKTLFWNPVIHSLNVAGHWVPERGWGWVTPEGYHSLAVDGTRAIRDVLDPGNSLMVKRASDLGYGGVFNGASIGGDFEGQVQKTLGHDMMKNPSKWGPIADNFGIPAYELGKKLYHGSSKAMWAASDIMLLQSTRERLRQMGVDEHTATDGQMRQAITRVERHIPNYRANTTIAGSRVAGKLAKDAALFSFGPYHYGIFNSYANMIKDVAKGTGPEKFEAVGQMLALGAMTYFIKPQVDKLWKAVTGNEDAEARPRGAATAPSNIGHALKTGDPMPFIRATATMSPLASLAVHAVTDWKDFGGQPFIDPQTLTSAGQGNLKDAAKAGGQLAGYLAQSIFLPLSSINQGLNAGHSFSQTFRDQILDINDKSDAAVKFEGKQDQYNAKAHQRRYKGGKYPNLIERAVGME